MARYIPPVNQVSGPINPSQLESVTAGSQDHRTILQTVNSNLAQHTTDISTLKSQIAALQAAVKALQS